MDTSNYRDPKKPMGYMRFTGLGKLAFIATIVLVLFAEKHFGIELNTKNVNITLFIAMTIGMVGGLIWATIGSVRLTRKKGDDDPR